MWTCQRWTTAVGPPRLADRLAESGPAVDHEEHRALEIEAALAYVGEEGLADGRVLGRALAQGEDVLAPLRIHAQRDEDDVIAEVQPVDEDDPDVEPVQGLGEPRGQLRARERDEAAGDATLRDGALADPRGQRVERPAILAGRDADRDRFQRAGVERIAARGVSEAGELELMAVDTPRAQARHEDTAAPERDLPADTAAPVGAALGVGDVLRPAEPRALLFHQRAQHQLPGVETETEERRARVGEDVEDGQRQLHRDDGRGRDRFPGGRSCATLLHGGSFRNGCGDRRPTMDGERSRRSFFSPSVQQAPGHPR